MPFPSFTAILLATAIYAGTASSATAEPETRSFFAFKATCVDGSPLPTYAPSANEIFHEVRGYNEQDHEVCTNVVDAALLPGQRPMLRRKCRTYRLATFSVMCKGGLVSAARWWAATSNERRDDIALDGDTLMVAMRGHSGWGGTPSRGFSGLTLDRGGVGWSSLPAGFGFPPRLKLHPVTLPWRDMVSGRAIVITGKIPDAIPKPAPAPRWIQLLGAGWPWLQIALAIAALLFAAIAFHGAHEHTFVTLILLSIVSAAGLFASAIPASLPDRSEAIARQQISLAHGQREQANRDRQTLRSLVHISAATGYVEPISAEDLLRAKNLTGTRNISPTIDTRSQPTLWATVFLAPSLVLILFFFPAFVRGWHALFVPHPATQVVARPLRRGALFSARNLGQALRPDPHYLHDHPPAYQSRNLLDKARALKERISADADIAEAAMRRDRARAAKLEAEAALREARRKLPWWRRWLVR